ncbi:HMA2 domain-containing protein [Aerosakkonemataceae cyanobacterium BLCC-F154]|uniref:HMA2 domain-containing protein n=1 Tax=Floridaenema fluviatile BLCC-F154 TaxID=3153640 RepID=A0ABV4YHW9_9CYAN
MGKKETTQTSSIELVQAIAGCIQLKANDPASNLWLNMLGQQLQQQKGVCAIQTEEATGNLVIIFDPRVLTLPSMLDLLQQWGVSGITPPQMSPDKQVGNFLYQHPNVDALLPMITGMIVTETLRLQGGWAMFVNLMTASFTRQLLNQIEASSNSVFATAENNTDSKLVELEAIAIPPQTISSENDSIEIVHAIPGRIRLRVPKLLKNPEYVQQLQELLSTDSSVTNLRISDRVGSVAISYYTNGMPDSAVRDRLIAVVKSTISPAEEPENLTDSPAISVPKLESNSNSAFATKEIQSSGMNTSWQDLKPGIALELLNSFLTKFTLAA